MTCRNNTKNHRSSWKVERIQEGPPQSLQKGLIHADLTLALQHPDRSIPVKALNLAIFLCLCREDDIILKSRAIRMVIHGAWVSNYSGTA